MSVRESPRLLFVLSNDYGELFDAACFVEGGGHDALFLMPPKLLAGNSETFPYRAARYDRAADVRAAVDEANPDFILLFSAYLFAINNIVDLSALASLVGTWRAQRRRVVTSDPFLGLMSTITDDTFNPRHPRQAWLKEHFTRLSHLLAGVSHVYHGPPLLTPSDSLSFFNSRVMLGESDASRARQELLEWEPIDESRRRWLFVLSPEDYGTQVATYGTDRFAGMVGQKLADASAAGRQPVLIAPEACIAGLQARARGTEGAVMASACGYARFMQLLHDAEYAFYWNMFSATIIARAVNRKPFFLFGRGHVALAIPPFFTLASRHFYPDCRIELLKQDRRLDAAVLADLAGRQETEVFAPALNHFQRSPGPGDLLAKLS